MSNIINKRINKLLEDNNLDAFLFQSNENRYWISRFNSTAGYVLVTKNKKILYLDGRYIEAGKEKAKNIDEVKELQTNNKNSLNIIFEDLKEMNLTKLGFSEEETNFKFYKFLQKEYDHLYPVNTNDIRTVKELYEIEYTQKACDISLEAFNKVIKKIKPGMKEKDIAIELSYEMMLLGADKNSFDSIVASGIRGSLPHGIASNKIINNNEMITIDFGCYYKGYASDITRTIAIGEPSYKLNEIYDVVKEAQKLGIEAIKPGVSSKEIDTICREYIQSKGYGQYFNHSTGHGLGLDVHEFPRISPFMDIELEENMIITVEPGIYIPGLGGVRIEDDILVTKNGYKILSNYDNEERNLIKI